MGMKQLVRIVTDTTAVLPRQYIEEHNIEVISQVILFGEEGFPDADIRVLDTRQIGANLATLVKVAVEMAEQGADADSIVSRLEEMISRARVYFLVDTLEYLLRGGRIGAASALLGSALQIKPILSMKDGQIIASEKVRTHNRAYQRLKEIVREQIDDPAGAYLSVGHADRLEEAKQLASELGDLGPGEIPIYNMGASITAHAEPGVLKVAFFVSDGKSMP